MGGIGFPRGVSVLFVFAVFLVAPFAARADQATSTSFKIETGVIDVGGSQATSSGFNLRTSLGQPGTGISTSTSFLLRGGFLNFPLIVVVAPVATSAPSGTSNLSVGGGPGPEEILRALVKCDLNSDTRCNIIDLSIMLFYYDRTGAAISRYDLNGNGRIDFPDISIIMYYWTG